MELDFGPYRERAQAQQMSPESAERIRKRLREECAKQTAVEAEQNLSMRPIPLVSKAAGQPAPRRKQHAALKAAACLAVCLGIGLLSVPVFQSLSDSPATAGAGIPSRPPQRIEFTHCGIMTPSRPSFDINAPFNPSDSFAFYADVKLFLPGVNADIVDVTVEGPRNFKLAPVDSALSVEELLADAGEQTVRARRWDGFAFTIEGLTEMDERKYDQCFRSGVGESTASARLIESLEDVRFIVSSGKTTAIYRIDFTESPDQRSAEVQMVHSAYRPIMFRLIQESE